MKGKQNRLHHRLHLLMITFWNTPVWDWCVERSYSRWWNRGFRRKLICLHRNRAPYGACWFHTDLYKIAVRLTVIFSSSQYSVVSELVVYREICFYLCVFGRATLAIVISPVVYIACICFSFHYFLELVSKSEVRMRMRNFQAFRDFLHNIASVCC